MIRPCTSQDFDTIHAIVNDAAMAYKGVIPADRWHEPYMPKAELRAAISGGVEFWGFETEGTLMGVMGVQPVQDVTLIRHAYVLTSHRRHGIGGQLLRFLLARIGTPTPDRHLGGSRLGRRVLPEVRVPARLVRGEGPPAPALLGRAAAADRDIGGAGR